MEIEKEVGWACHIRRPCHLGQATLLLVMMKTNEGGAEEAEGGMGWLSSKSAVDLPPRMLFPLSTTMLTSQSQSKTFRNRVDDEFVREIPLKLVGAAANDVGVDEGETSDGKCGRNPESRTPVLGSLDGAVGEVDEVGESRFGASREYGKAREGGKAEGREGGGLNVQSSGFQPPMDCVLEDMKAEATPISRASIPMRKQLRHICSGEPDVG
ncbi:hypothetical protein M407DRAFT_236301 [Tulasnella calospora MUT 4182]|uniref:Uncharacterized protein n=1 Tax=Tulasnella calospora MUT 4182 TaxID=1051891 RepID=A0A0C3KWW8_9AGAM|nr:hypothetical protein M407DRAFT_236301 [Tulasnella calospora MUT 4182]